MRGQAERAQRRNVRRLLDALDAGAVDFAAVRRALLEEPGVRLLASKTRRRRRKVERLDLLAYRRPGGPRRASYWLVLWAPGWEHRPFVALIITSRRAPHFSADIPARLDPAPQLHDPRLQPKGGPRHRRHDDRIHQHDTGNDRDHRRAPDRPGHRHGRRQLHHIQRLVHRADPHHDR